MRRRNEHRLHVEVAKFLSVALKAPTFWSSIDHGAGKMSIVSAAMMKARGVRSGLPDVLVIHPGKMSHMATVIGIELKAGKGRQSPAQREICNAMRAAGADYVVCRSIDDVADELWSVGIPLHARPA